MNLARRFKNRDIGSLEQACERYATMAYEVFRRELTIAFKSVTYSYVDDDSGGNNVVYFSATFIPREQTALTPNSRFGRWPTCVTFRVIAEAGTGSWILTDGQVIGFEGRTANSPIRFSRDYGSIALHIPRWDLIRVGASHYCEEMPDTPENRQEWKQLPGMVKV